MDELIKIIKESQYGYRLYVNRSKFLRITDKGVFKDSISNSVYFRNVKYGFCDKLPNVRHLPFEEIVKIIDDLADKINSS